MVTQFWKNYDSKSSYDGYISDDSKIRKHAKIISGILEFMQPIIEQKKKNGL